MSCWQPGGGREREEGGRGRKGEREEKREGGREGGRRERTTFTKLLKKK